MNLGITRELILCLHAFKKIAVMLQLCQYILEAYMSIVYITVNKKSMSILKKCCYFYCNIDID